MVINFIILSIIWSGPSIKNECLSFGKITNLEFLISLAIFSLCLGVHPPSFSPVINKQGFDKPFNQGNIYTFDTDEFVAAMESAEEKATTVNAEGIKLQKEFTYEKTLNKILEVIQNDTP